MVWHPIILMLVDSINVAASALTPFTPHWAAFNSTLFMEGLSWAATADKFFPVHDGAFPIFLASTFLMVAMYSWKGVISLVNLIRGSGM